MEGVLQNGKTSSLLRRQLDVEKMAVLCREFGISRKTGYKIFNRYKDSGLEGLADRSRGPSATQTRSHSSSEGLWMRVEELEASFWFHPR